MFLENERGRQMKRLVLLRSCLLFAAVFIVAFMGCGDERQLSDDKDFFVDVETGGISVYSEDDIVSSKNQVRAAGLLDEFPLRSIKAFRDTEGEIQGSFSLFGGSIEGSLGPENNYIFFWTKDGVTYPAELPASRVVFALEEGLTQPTVKFKFQVVNGNVREKNSELLSKPSVWINEGHIFLATVKISSDKFGEYILIP